MKLLSFWTIVFLVSVCFALPPNNSFGPQEDSQQPQSCQLSQSRNFASHVCNRIYPSSPKLNYRQSQNSLVDLLRKFLLLEASVMDSSSTALETRLIDLPGDLFGMIALKTGSHMDVMNFALAGKPFHHNPTVRVILDILRFCSVKGDRVFPNLELAAPPTNLCAERIVASNGHFLIETLSMTSIQMTLGGAHSIASIVRHTNLVDLTLRECQLTYEMLVSITNVLPDSELTTLNLGWNKINETGAIAIAAALPESKLTSLYLVFNYIGDHGASAIAAALPLSKLTSLHLVSNFISDDGASAIAAVLPDSKLTSLYLRHTNIGGEGASAIAAALPRSELTSLDLRWNDVDAGGAIAIAAFLPKSKLTSLNLEQNKIGDEGAAAIAIAAALPHSMLTSLYIGQNGISHEGAKAYAAALTRSKLTKLNLEYNKVVFLKV